VTYTQEDMEAKGLRKLEDPKAPRPPVHFTALEMASKERGCLFFGESGAGKTSFALDLALHLAGELLGDARYGVRGLTRSVARNELGMVIEESWKLPAAWPILHTVQPGEDWGSVIQRLDDAAAKTSIVLIVDGVELFADPEDALRSAALLLAARPDLRLVLLGNGYFCRGLAVPDTVAQFTLLPLTIAQRRDYMARHGCTSDPALLPSRPDLFVASLALSSPPLTDPLSVAESWLAQAATPDQRAALTDSALLEMPARSGDDALVGSDFARTVLYPALSARALAELQESERDAHIVANPRRWRATVPLLARVLDQNRADVTTLARTLLQLRDPSAIGVLLGAEIALLGAPQLELVDDVRVALAAMIARGDATLSVRDQAARILSRLGDPRDLAEMVVVPHGTSTIGSDTHPNSQPVHDVTLETFRIGRYPVTVAAYAAFVEDTARAWTSPDASDPERANAPATDLTWHDAQAYCAWLTARWRQQGLLAECETIRLPTEMEWERAARGTQPAVPGAVCYPWSAAWEAGRSNSAELGLNATTAVGLCPAGRSAYGAEDMAGGIWEWTTTLWGQDMANPSFTYPYRNDGREDLSADDTIRRVLRGGCFSSNRMKACCSYRGSLEPNGFWRGNGFRIVLGRHFPYG